MATESRTRGMGTKHGLILTLVLIFPLILPAQLDGNSSIPLPSFIEEEEERKKPARKMDRLIFELTTDRWLEVPEGIELRPYSPGFSVFGMHDYPMGSQNFALAWGYGVSSINVHHNGAIIENEEEDHMELLPLEEGIDYRKNKTSATYFDLAAEVRIRSNGDRPFKLILGARGGALISMNQKFKDDDETIKRKIRRNVLPYHFGLTARIAVGRIGLTSFYSLTPLFEEGNNTELIPISGGIFFTF